MAHQAWIVAVDMGYGHQRAAFPLRHLSPTGQVISANNYDSMPKSDYNLWNNSRKFYEFFSQMSSLPLIGKFIFGILDKFQAIHPFYPHHDESVANMQVKQNYFLFKRGLGKHLVEMMNKKSIPLITTFFTVAFAAEAHGFKQDIYLVICDSDVSRTWAPLEPRKSRIKYLAPCRRVVERLKSYGIREENIFLTGFPLPEENTDGPSLSTLKHDLAERIINLDPERHYRAKYAATVKLFLKDIKIDERHHHPLTLTFAVGGAGAQRNIAHDLIISLSSKLRKGEINLNLVAGTRNDVYDYFISHINKHNLRACLDKNIRIIFNRDREQYFKEFNEALRSTDILWTKPSEMVFYSALGLPIIMAPSLGSQEVFNRTWLKTIGAGIAQEDPKYTHEWLFDWVNSGWLAEAAMSGFLDGRQFGVTNIMDVVFHGVREPTKGNSLL